MKKKIYLVLLICLAVFVGLFVYIKIDKSRPKHFQITFFNVGQGDAALIQFDDGEKMLVDCGPDRKILSKLGQALPFYDRSIDYLIVSHPDNDHYGGCVDVLKQYKVREIVENGLNKEYDPYWQIWNRAVRQEGAVLKVINGAQEWNIASTTLEFFSPDNSLDIKIKTGDTNNHSIVFKLIHNGKSFLLVGDMEELLERALMERYCATTSLPLLSKERLGAAQRLCPEGEVVPLDALGSHPEGKPPLRSPLVRGRGQFPCPTLKSDILKVGHHGSDSSSGEEFLKAVSPQQAVISIGKNTYGHPSLRTIKKLERVGAQILRTDEEGDIIMK